ncbi:uncharacterized protein LOC117111640 isoform X2 [Anneissia japonica]|uniref:uncharacterized protein LOC117111640 isoform X2 n=1 Tax=Anneissia japonica TaxID=1529436 RepID=UPI0014255B72|nr:uncharacterized protein LOC117111640 isoform X2 [Anneissia japonica]
MDIVSMALTSVQQNSELLGLATVAQQDNDVQTVEGGLSSGVQALSDHASVDTSVGLGLGSNTCPTTMIGNSVVTPSISENGTPILLVMRQEELIRPPPTETSALLLSKLPTTAEKQSFVGTQTLQNGEDSFSKVVEKTGTETSTATRPATISTSSNLMNSIPVELSSSTSAASSILGSIASMIDQNAANVTNTSIVSTDMTSYSTLTNTTTSSTNNADRVALPRALHSTFHQSQAPLTVPQTIAKEPRLPLTVPLQTKSAATITIKTPLGTSLTGPNGSMSGPLLQTILNNAEVQALMKRNPGQQITIVQIPDESLGNTNCASNSIVKSAATETKKIIPGTKINHSSVGRKRKKLEESEEKAKPQKITRPVKKITRSGRISRPPLYRIRDYKTIHPTEEVESGSSEEDYKDYSIDEKDRDASIFSDKPKNFKCTNCDKSYIGQASLDRHFRQNPTHGTPVGPSPEKKLPENTQSMTVDSDEVVKPAEQISTEAGDINSSETTTSPAPRLQYPSTRGRGRGMRRRRGRGRPPIYSNHADKPYSLASSSVWINTEKVPLDKRKQKAKELMKTFEDEDFLDVILPRMTRILSPFEFLLMKAEGEESRSLNFIAIYNEYLSLVQEVKKVAQGCLAHIPEMEKSDGGSFPPVKRLNVEDAAVADSLGLSTGWYEVKDTFMPVNSGNHNVTRKEPEKLMKPVEPVEPERQPAKKAKVDENKNGLGAIPPKAKTKIMPSLTPLRNRPLNLKSVVTPGPIVEHPIPPGRPLPELKPLAKEVSSESMKSTSLAVSQVSLQPTISSSTAILSESFTSSPELMETISTGEENADSSELPMAVEDDVPLLQSVDGDVSGLQLVTADGIQDVLPEVDDTSPIDIMPVGSTLMQLQDGTFLVQKPDGTTIQIQAPEGMTIETIQELLSVDGTMHPADAPEMALAENEDVVMVPGLDVNSADLSNEVAAT